MRMAQSQLLLVLPSNSEMRMDCQLVPRMITPFLTLGCMRPSARRQWQQTRMQLLRTSSRRFMLMAIVTLSFVNHHTLFRQSLYQATRRPHVSNNKTGDSTMTWNNNRLGDPSTIERAKHDVDRAASKIWKTVFQFSWQSIQCTQEFPKSLLRLRGGCRLFSRSPIE